MPNPVTDLTKRILDLNHKSKVLERLRRLVEHLDKIKLEPIEGERWLLGQLEPRLDHGRSLLEQISTSAGPKEFQPFVTELGDLLQDVTWDLLDDVVEQLEQKTAAQDARIREYGDVLAQWRPYANTLRQDLTMARNKGVPLIQDERFLSRLDTLIASLDRAIQEQNFLAVPGLIQEIKKEGRPADLESDRIDQRVKQKRSFVLQADLLLLRPPLNDARKFYEYTVLLRTPSRPGSHGVNIQGTSTIVNADRDRLTSQFAKVTAALNHATQRKAQFDAETASAGQESKLNPMQARDIFVRDPELGEAPSEDPNALLKEIGDFMFRIFIPEQIAQFLKTQPCSLTLTTNDLELPWELMLTDNNLKEEKFICLERPVARLPMGYVVPRLDYSELVPSFKKRFLLICSDPDNNLPGAKREIEMIRSALQERWKDDVEVETLQRTDATGDRMNEVLRGNRFDVIHYAGHASFDAGKPDLSALLLCEREPFFAQKIRRLLKGRPLVVLNACQSAATSNPQQAAEVRYELQEAEGLAAAFIYGGALGCLGATWPVFDGPAAEFAIAFYNQILEGEMIGEAVRHARIEVQKAHVDGITWASFTLYGDPTFRVFS